MGTALPVESEKLTALPSPITATLTTLTPMGNAGYLLISQDQLSQPIELAIGQRFTIQLDEGFTWEVRVAKPDILLPLSDPVVGPGFAASFEALQAGQSQLDISGDPLCRQATPPCMRPSLFFSVIVRVK
ncbi:MAG: protease inhibitor I42 family protein [Anaerolineales bacterium]|nr:protease inhibitor I42 family protein [Anaerolineales bacterium]